MPGGRSRIQLLNKGFLGPIGDDLPSLVPLMFALIIFFSTFSFTWGIFDRRNLDFNDDLYTLRIARVLKSNGYISGSDNFDMLCKSLGIINLKYRAGITNAETAPDEYTAQTGLDAGINIFEIEFYESDGYTFECTNVEPAEFLTVEGSIDKKIIARIYPIALEDNRVVLPMHLVVIAWK